MSSIIHALAAALAGFIMLTMPGMARAEFIDGNGLLERIDSDEPVVQAVALGYVGGVFDTLRGITHCPPERVTLGQVRDMTRAWLVANPSTRNDTADAIIGRMLKRVWPCPTRGSAL